MVRALGRRKIRGELEEKFGAIPLPRDLGVLIEDVALVGGDTWPEFRVRIYRPDSGKGAVPAFLHLHGGGFVLGSLTLADAENRTLAAELGCVIVAVDYPLAPEHPYPQALEACMPRSGGPMRMRSASESMGESASKARAQAGAWRLLWRSWHAIGARSRLRSSTSFSQ